MLQTKRPSPRSPKLSQKEQMTLACLPCHSEIRDHGIYIEYCEHFGRHICSLFLRGFQAGFRGMGWVVLLKLSSVVNVVPAGDLQCPKDLCGDFDPVRTMQFSRSDAYVRGVNFSCMGVKVEGNISSCGSDQGPGQPTLKPILVYLIFSCTGPLFFGGVTTWAASWRLHDSCSRGHGSDCMCGHMFRLCMYLFLYHTPSLAVFWETLESRGNPPQRQQHIDVKRKVVKVVRLKAIQIEICKARELSSRLCRSDRLRHLKRFIRDLDVHKHTMCSIRHVAPLPKTSAYGQYRGSNDPKDIGSSPGQDAQEEFKAAYTPFPYSSIQAVESPSASFI